MSGAHVTDVTVAYEDGTPLDGLWSEDAQAWTIAGSTTNASSVALLRKVARTAARQARRGAGGGGMHARPGGGLGHEKPTKGATLTITVKVAEGNAEDVAMHFICVMCDMMCGTTATDPPPPPPPPALPPPPPREEWKLTGSWGKGAYTKGWGPPSGKTPFPPSQHPEVYSIKGSINRGLTGSLSIIAAECKGWTVISFSGAEVASVHVTSASGEVLSGTLSVSTQTWTPYVMSTGRRKKRGALGSEVALSSTPKPNELTAGATYYVTVTVAKPLTFDDVNAYFVTVPCKEPFSAPHEKPAPTPEPEEPCDVEPTPTPTPEEPCEVEKPTRAPTMAPTRAPTPATCAECVDKEPPPSWAEPTCARQLSSGQCAERARMADGYCMATCGLCTPCPVDTVHGDPMFKHNGEGFKFSIPVGRPTDLLSWSGKGGKKAVLSGTAFERARTGNQWFDSLALSVGGKEVFNVSVAKVAPANPNPISPP